MNPLAPLSTSPHVVIGADGYPRRAFSITDLERMTVAGLIEPDERLELVDGELLPMSPKRPLHETLKIHLNLHLVRHLPPGFIPAQEPGWRLSPTLYLEPDFLVFPAELEIGAVTGPLAALVIEIADSSFAYDTVRKAGIYASLGVRDYWVIDAGSRATRIHREPGPRGYSTVTAAGSGDVLMPAVLPGYGVRLKDLPGG